MTKTFTHKWYLKELKALGTTTIPLGKYTGANVSIAHQCGCGNVWEIKPSSFLRSKTHRCSKCAYVKTGSKTSYTHAEIIARIKKIHGVKIQLVGQYRGINHKYRFRCNPCGRSWKASMNNVLNSKSGCPTCATQLPSRINNGRNGYKFKTVEIHGCTFKVQGYEPQAIEWLLRNYPKIKAKDIKVDTSGEVPTIRYKIGRRNRTYFPDMYLPKLNHIVEIKSTYTSGLLTGKGWKKNQQKAKAVLAAGYKFSFLIFDKYGFKLSKLPKEWYKMTRLQVLTYLAHHNPANSLADGVIPNKPIHTKAEIIATAIVEAIQAMPRESRKGQKQAVVAVVAQAISKYI